MKKIELLHFTVAKKPGLTGFEQMIKFVSSNWFAAKSVEQMRVEQSQFEQFTPTRSTYQDFNFFLGFYGKVWYPFKDESPNGIVLNV